MQVSFETMLNQSIQLLIWRHSKKAVKVHAECWIGFAKIFQHERQSIY
jgi:hypothetical protein